MKVRLTGIRLAEDGGVGANLDGLVTADSTRDDDNFGGVARDSSFEGSKRGNSHGGSRSTASSTKCETELVQTIKLE